MDKLQRLPINVRVAAVFLAVGAVWGSAWIPTQALSHSLPQTRCQMLTGALRFALAAIVLAVPAVLIRRRRPANQRPPLAPLFWPSALLGATMVALPYALTAWAAGRVSPGLVAVWFALMPLGVLLFGREEGSGGVTVAVLGIGGVAMLVDPGISLRGQQLPGLAALSVAVGLGGFSLFYVRKLHAQSRLRSNDLLLMSAIQMAVASVIMAAVAVAAREPFSLPALAGAALPVAILAVVVSAGTLPLLLWLLGRIPAWHAATLQWITTLVAVTEALVMLRARPNYEAWIGAAVISASIAWIFARDGGEAVVSAMPASLTSET